MAKGNIKYITENGHQNIKYESHSLLLCRMMMNGLPRQRIKKAYKESTAQRVGTRK